MPRMVQCVKLGRELPGLEKPPFPGPLGQRIFEHISKQAYEMWPAQSTLIINHYGLNMADPESRKILREQMEEFFFGADAQMPEGWVPEEAGVGAGAGPSSKGGGGGPARKK
ncbi:MAG TPA: oxidative damage protection protein [Ktedonobacteraceae bacterium]|nr:oxidative damage protection protein [Ktedonobacteraceae bacterium]